MDYPKPSEVETCLATIVADVKPSAATPFRVSVLPVYGGKPPVYTVMMLAPDREPIRQILAGVLKRRLSLGSSSFALHGDEALMLLSYRPQLYEVQQKNTGSGMGQQ